MRQVQGGLLADLQEHIARMIAMEARRLPLEERYYWQEIARSHLQVLFERAYSCLWDLGHKSHRGNMSHPE